MSEGKHTLPKELRICRDNRFIQYERPTMFITLAEVSFCRERGHIAKTMVERYNSHEQLVEALKVISSYGHGTDTEGTCPYGCDTPTIASKALKAAGEKVQ